MAGMMQEARLFHMAVRIQGNRHHHCHCHLCWVAGNMV